MTYKIAVSYNNAAGLTALSIQPRMNGLVPGRRTTASDGTVYQDGFLSCELIFDYLTPAQYTALLSEMGLSSATSAKVTITLPANISRTDTNYNAIIELPAVPQQGAYERRKWLSVSFNVTRIEAI